MPPNREVAIFYETEGCTAKNLEPCTDLLHKCDFHTIIAHQGVKVFAPGLSEKSVETMREIPDGDGSGYGVFQPNSIYIFCLYDDSNTHNPHRTPSLSHHPLYAELQKPISNFESITVPIEVDQKIQREYFEFPLSIEKHLRFIYKFSPSESNEIGWYNLRTNILWISDITNNPYSSNKILIDILEKVYNLKTFGKLKSDPIVIGADPEFELLDKNDALLPAHMFFPYEGQVGTNGHSATGEIRPTAGRSPLQLARNIKRLLRKTIKTQALPIGTKICAGGGTKVTTGGHIHFNIKSYTPEMRNILYDLVGKHVLKYMTGMRCKSTALISRNGEDSFREASSHPGFEWRLLPSWLYSEEACKDILTTTYCIMKAINVGNYSRVLDSDIATLRNLPLYPIYKPYIERFISTYITGEKKIKMEGTDLVPNWKLIRPQNNYTIKIIAHNQAIKRYFAPVVYPLENEVTIQIEFCGQKLAVLGFDSIESRKLEKLARVHFVEFIRRTNIDDFLRDVSGYSQYDVGASNTELTPNIIVCLPIVWAESSDKKRLFKQISSVLQEAAIRIGKEI